MFVAAVVKKKGHNHSQDSRHKCYFMGETNGADRQNLAKEFQTIIP